VTFNPGETNKTVTVQVYGETLYESDETFSVQISNAVNAGLGTTTAIGTIQNDDRKPQGKSATLFGIDAGLTDSVFAIHDLNTLHTAGTRGRSKRGR